VRVCLEAGRRRVFASALDWPGWCRVGRTEQDALDTLAAYAARFAPVAAEAGLVLPDDAILEVIERLPGNATTDFGAPAIVADAERAPTDADAARRIAGLVTASWHVLDRVTASAPATLRKGPRGGGRDRDQVVQHVVNAEAAYARKLGVRHRAPAASDEAAVTALRDEILAVLSRPSDGEPLVDKGWPVRYAARRIAWHVLDHAWEIEDKSTP
jgi:hypothetical protein